MTTTQEIEAAIRVVDANLTLMKEPLNAASGEKKAHWMRLFDRELDARSKLSAMKKELESPAAKPALEI